MDELTSRRSGCFLIFFHNKKVRNIKIANTC
nr:MAG TPA: hypothetical protein [Bacteriophage sp.]